jgi:hypothetical protein
MSVLAQELAAKKAAEEPSPTCCTSASHGGAYFIELRPDPRTKTGFPVAQLCHYTLEANPGGGDEATEAPERLTLGFSTADVAIVGARLGKLVELINEHGLASVSAVDARYAGTVGRGPWVARITIARIDKPGAGLG